MILLVPSLVRKCDGKASVRHQVMVWLQRLGEEKWKGEGSQEITVIEEKTNPNLDQGKCAGNVGRKDTWIKTANLGRENKEMDNNVEKWQQEIAV